MLGTATFEKPPNNLYFDHRATKKQRTKASGTHVEIHNHIPNSAPLTDHAGQNRANTSTATPSISRPLDDDDDDYNIIFPDIEDALKQLNKVAPKDQWLIYEAGLRQYGVNYVDGGAEANATFLENEVCMPIGLIPRFQALCSRMAARARKEARRGLVKLEDGEENAPIVIE